MATILLFAGLMIWHNWKIEHEVQLTQETAWADEFNLDLERVIKSESQGLEQTLHAINAQPALIQALAQKDAARLQADWKDLFEQLRAEHGVTHFYFINPDRTCLLRLHLPEQHGDHIDRNTLLEAERSSKTAWGVEMGGTGVLTLRVVQPVFDGDRLLGYLELGKEYELLLTRLRPSDELAYRFAVLLHKSHIDRTSWEAGMRMLNRQADWDALPRHVVQLLGPGFNVTALQSLLSRPDWDNPRVHPELDERRWHLQLLPLRVTGGEEVGTLIILHDINDAESVTAHRAMMLVLVTLTVASGVIALFVWLIRRFSRQIRERDAALYAENAKNQALLRNASDGIHILDDQGCLLEASDAFCDSLGYSREELIGQNIVLWDAMMPHNQLVPKLNQQIEAGSRMQFETRHRRKDGSVFDVEVSGQPLTIGNRRYIFNSSRDITVRKQTENALRESEQRFRQLFELSPDAAWVMDEHRFEECNLAAVKLFALESRQRFLHMHPADVSPEWQADGESSFAKAERMMDIVDSQGIHRFEWLHQRVNGRLFDAEVTLSSIILQGKKRIYAQVRDITDRKRVENALRQSEEKLRIILDSVDAFIYLKDMGDGNYLFANAAVRQLWQVEMDDIIGYSDKKFFDAETSTNIRHNDRRVLEEGIVFREEETNTVTESGLTFTCLTVKLPLRGQDGHIYALCGISTDITDRKRIEEEARKREHDLKEAQRIAKVGSWELDIFNNRLTWSDEIYRIFEIDPARFGASYDAFIAAIHPEDRDAVNQAYTNSLNTRQPYSIRHRLMMADGRLKYVHEQCQTDFDADGNPLRSIGTVQDVTEQVQAETALHEAHDLLQTVIDHAPMRVFWKDCELRYLGCNPAFAQDAGCSQPSELIGQDDYQMSWAHEADLYRADDRAIIESGIARINFEEPQTSADGQTLWLRTSKVPLKMRNGKIIGVLGIYEDITAEKAKDDELVKYREHLEQLVQERSSQLAEAQLKYQRLLDDMGDEFLAFSFTPDTQITYVGNGTEAIFGLTKDRILGQSWAVSIPWLPEDLQKAQLDIEDLLSGKIDSTQTEMRFFHPSGQIHTIYATSRAVKDAFSNAIAVDGILTDITQRKQHQAELLEAKLTAEAANRAKSAFLANMSHEIRTPMNGVIGMLEILSHSPLPREERKMVETIRRSARSLLGIINDILDFSKIEAGKLSLVEQEISLETELDIVIGMIDRIAMDKQVDLTMFFEPRLPLHVLGDGLRLRQILTNLAGNAVKFSAGMGRIGRVQLRAELEGCENGLATVAFTIADNGIGMDAEIVARLFQPFEQADDSTTRKYGGTGLGLAISHNLTSMMGGNIAVQSEVGQGAIFTVRLPFKVASECPNTASPYDLSGLECILVASESRYQDDYTRYLAHAGAHTHVFTDLEVAWTFIASYTPPPPVCMIVIEDPGIHSGREIVDRLLARHLGDHVHFVEVTYLSVERGRRRKVRRLADRIVQIDREALTRNCFLLATAVATGRAIIPQDSEDMRIAVNSGVSFDILVAEDNEINRDVIRRQLAMLGYRTELAVDGREALQKWETAHYDLLLTDLHMPNLDGYELTSLIREAET